MIAASVATATTGATSIISGAGNINAPRQVRVYNNGASTVYLGGPTVTTTAGYPLASATEQLYDLAQGDDLYGIVAAGSVEVRVIRGRA